LAVTRILSESGCDILVTPVDQAGTNGCPLFEEAQRLRPDLPILVSAKPSLIREGIRALRSGAEDLLHRPLVPEQVQEYAERVFQKRSTVLENGHEQGLLRRLVLEKTKKLQIALTDAQGTFNATVEVMVSAIEARDCETQHHCRRAREYSLLLGRQMGVQGRDLRDLAWGALLHDVGKISVPDHILLKAGPLTPGEWDIMKTHPLVGYRLLAPVKFLNGAATIVLCHHEKWNGSGYPYGKHGEEIPLGARIFMVADAFETITSKRSYKEALPFEYARDEIIASAGSHFDPDVVEAFLEIERAEWLAIRNRYMEEIQAGRTIVQHEIPASAVQWK